MQRRVPSWLFAIGLLGAADWGFGWYALRHFLPAHKLGAALSAGSGCVGLAGDSRMAAAATAVAERLGAGRGAPRLCVVDLSLGGVGLAGEAVFVRTYLERGGRPDLLVLGTVPESIVRNAPVDPSDWIGSEALTLLWSRAGDAKLHFGGRPRNIGELDSRIRYEIYRRSSLATFRSSLWRYGQRLQDHLVGGSAGKENRFGGVEDMRALGDRFRGDAEAALRDHRPGMSWSYSPWLDEMMVELAKHGVRLIFAELPMPSNYRAVRESPAGRSLRSQLRDDLESRGGWFVDVSAPPGFTDGLFEDGIHLGPEGARVVSETLALAVTERDRRP